jgi:hypothetical protein
MIFLPMAQLPVLLFQPLCKVILNDVCHRRDENTSAKLGNCETQPTNVIGGAGGRSGADASK